MEEKEKATAKTTANENDTAKLQKESKLISINLSVTIATDPDPMDWNELDSLMSKPPKTERKPRKAAYIKPALVKKFEAVTGNTYRDDTANGLTRLIIDCIRHGGGQAERINTTGIPIDTRQEVTDLLGHRHMIGSLTWRKGGSTVGSADISATINGRSVKIEVKIGKDRQSEAQKAYQREVEAAGGLYYIAHDFTSFVKWYSTIIKGGGAR